MLRKAKMLGKLSVQLVSKISLLSPRKFSRTWTSEDEDKDLKIGPQVSSKTRTFLEDNNTGGSKSSVRPSVRPSVRLWRWGMLCFSHRLEYFENNFTAE